MARKKRVGGEAKGPSQGPMGKGLIRKVVGKASTKQEPNQEEKPWGAVMPCVVSWSCVVVVVVIGRRELVPSGVILLWD